jgi:hypothetical protein
MVDQYLISAEEASQILHHHKKYIYKLQDRGILKGFKVRGKWFFLRSDVEKLSYMNKDNQIIKENEPSEEDITMPVHKEPENVDTELFEALVRHAAKLSMLDKLKRHNCIDDSEYVRIKNYINKQFKNNNR